MKLFGLFATLAAAQSTTTNSNNDSPTPTPTPTPMPGSLPKFEVDIIHPRNTTYNLTSHLPIVFAFQNFDALTSLQGLTFTWVIQHFDWPSFRRDEDQKDYYLGQDNLNPESQELVVSGSPYILVDSSQTDRWRYQPQEWEEQEGKLYSLTWYVQWTDRMNCTEKPWRLGGNKASLDVNRIFFTVVNDRERKYDFPALDQLAMNSTCAQTGEVAQINKNNATACSFYQALPLDQGNACGVKLDPPKLQSISSEAAVKATATPTSSSSSTGPIPTPTKNSAALAVVELALLGTLGSMSILSLS